MVLGLSRAYESLKEYKTALEEIGKFKSLKDQFFQTDKDYQHAYWDALLAEGNCNRQGNDYEAAARCYKDILNQKIEEELWPGEAHKAALLGLFATWNDMKDYHAIVEFMRSWKNATARDRGPAYWLQKMAYDESLHGHVATAAKHANAVDELCSLYQEAIDHQPEKPTTTEDQDNRSSPYTKGQLQYYQAVLRFHGSQSQHDHLLAIKSWEEIVQKSDDSSISWFTAYSASKILARCLLDKAATESTAASSELSGRYMSRLEALAKMNNRVIRDLRQGQTDPRLCLLRLYHLRGESSLAAAEAQNRLSSVFDKWPENPDDDSLQLRFQNLAQTLTVLDKDDDAIAAWQALKPQPSSEPTATNTKPSDPHQQADSSPDNATPNGTTSTAPSNGIDAASEPPTSTPSSPPKAYIHGYTCDGCDTTDWPSILSDCWVCKNCLCVQLCPSCYSNLQTTTTTTTTANTRPLVCAKTHKFLYLPPLDTHALQSSSSDTLTLANRPIPRVQFLNKIRDEFKVQQEQIDVLKIEKARELKAATCIARHILRWRRRLFLLRAARQARVGGGLLVMPVLRRAQTVR